MAHAAHRLGPVESWALVSCAVASVSLSAPVTAVAVVPAVTLAFWRTGLGALATLPFAVPRLVGPGVEGRPARRLVGSAVSGVFLAVHFCLWLPSLRLTSVAAATALVSTPPVWTVLVERVLGRPVARRTALGTALALGGVLVVTGVDLGHGGRAVLGDLLALGGGLAMAGYVLLGERERAHLPAGVYTTVVYAVAASVTLPVCLVSGAGLVGFPARGWLEIAVITVFAQLLGHTLLNIAVPVVGATPLALALLLEVPGAAFIAWAWFGERPPAGVVPGALLVLAGLALVLSARPARPVPPS